MAPTEQELHPRPDADGDQMAGQFDFGNEGIEHPAGHRNASLGLMEQELPPRPDAYGNASLGLMEQELPPRPDAYGEDSMEIDGDQRGSRTPHPPSCPTPSRAQKALREKK
jgi:hypothetical protein